MIEHVFPAEMMHKREEQLIMALADCAGAYYDINFTKDRILGKPIQVVDGEVQSIQERIGMPENCSYTDMVSYWGNTLAPEDQEGFFQFFDIKRIKDCYAKGERLITYSCWRDRWIRGAIRTMHKIRLYEDCTNGDLLGLAYVSDDKEYEAVQRQEAMLAQRYKEAFDRAAFLEAMSANVPGGYHRCGVGDGFPLEFVSDSFLKIVGWTRAELKTELNNQFINVVAPEDREFFMSHEPALVRDGQISVVYRIHRKDGSRRWVQDATMHVEKDGMEYYQCVLADITDFVNEQEELNRKNMELLQQRTLMEIIEENMPSGYHRCKAEEGCPFVYIGKHFLDIVGYTEEEIREEFGNLFRNLIWHEDAEKMVTYENMRKMVGKGNSYDTSVYRIKHKNGGYRWISDSTMFVDLGERSFYQATIVDITEYIENLNEARKKAEESNLAKSTFLFNASHDIRTPMNAIQGFADMIEDNAEDPQKVLDAVRKLKQSGDILLTLLNDVLELSRIERGKETVENHPLDMVAHTSALNEMMRSEMEQKGIDFRIENDIVHPFVMADDLKLTRIAMNLLSNAKKFTPEGGKVCFGVKESNYDGKKATYSLFVQDTSIGMSKEFQAKAFEQFERERSSTDSRVPGSGLGLAIIKKIADLIGGTCEIHSELGKGTEIICAVPLTVVDQAEVEPETNYKNVDFSGKRVLLVEDNEFNREIARYVFEGMGFWVEEAENGVACLEQLNRVSGGYYDCVLMDIQMPVMDGYKATEEIRRHQDSSIAVIPIIAMTANAFEEDRKKCFRIGMDGHISKPLEAAVVLQELTRVLKK